MKPRQVISMNEWSILKPLLKLLYTFLWENKSEVRWLVTNATIPASEIRILKGKDSEAGVSKASNLIYPAIARSNQSYRQNIISLIVNSNIHINIIKINKVAIFHHKIRHYQCKLYRHYTITEQFTRISDITITS